MNQPLRLHATLASLLIVLTAACATLPPDPRMLDNARTTLEQASLAGAAEYAPLELRFARERLDEAVLALQAEDAVQARRLSDEAELEARLALARTRAALTRARLAEQQQELEQLKRDLVESFGEEVLQ